MKRTFLKLRHFILVFTIKLLTIIKKYCELKTKNYDNLSLIIKKPLKYKALQKKELEEVGLKEEEIHSIRHFKGSLQQVL